MSKSRSAEKERSIQSLKFESFAKYQYSKKIMGVAFDSYKQDGGIKFYPKVVVLADTNKEASKGPYVFLYDIVEIYSLSGDLIARLEDQNTSGVNLSKNGNFIGINRIVYQEPWDPWNSEILESDFTVYNDKGQMVWKRTNSVGSEKAMFQEFSAQRISPIDGSVCVFSRNIRFYNKAEVYTYPLIYSEPHFAFSDDWKYIAIGGVRDAERKVALLDSLFRVLWEQPVEGDWIHQVSVSPSGSYLSVSSYIEYDLEKRRQWDKRKGPPPPSQLTGPGCLYNKDGKLLMNLPPYGPEVLGFSQDEQYFLVKYNPNLTRSELGNGWWIEVFNTLKGKSVFRKALSSNPLDGAVYDNGAACIITGSRPKLTERVEELPPPTLTIYLFKPNGDLIGRSDSIETKISYKFLDGNGSQVQTPIRILDFDGSQATIASIEEQTGVVTILLVMGGK